MFGYNRLFRKQAYVSDYILRHHLQCESFYQKNVVLEYVITEPLYVFF